MIKNSTKKNYLYNVSYQILLLLTPLITTPYISRVLGADGVGQVSYAESIVSYFTLFACLGITSYGQREISYVQDSKEKRSEIFWNTKILQFCTSGISLIIYIIFAFCQINSSIYLFFVLNILTVFADVTWFFQGMEEFGRIIIRNIIFKIVNIVYIFMVIKSKDDILLYVLGLSFFMFISNVSLWFYLPKFICRPIKGRIHPFIKIKVVLSLFVPTIAIQIYTVLDKTMIGVIAQNSFENGYYEQALKLSKMVMTVVTSLGTVMIPRIGYHFQNKESNEVKRLIYRGYRFVWFLGIPLCVGLASVAGNFVPWFYGDGYERVIDLLRILSLLIIAIGISNVTGMQYLVPTKRQNLFTLSVIIGAVINFFMNVILIKIFQSIGAAIASVTAEIIIAIAQLMLVRKEISPWKVIRESFHYLIAGVIMGVVLYLVGGLLTPSIIHTIILIACGGCVYFTVLLIIRDDFFMSNVSWILKKIR